MNNPAVQQALIELEESLSKIESARTQVNNVAEKSEQLIRSFTKTLDAINSINKNISFDKELVNSQISDSLKVFQSGLSKIVKESESKVKDLEGVLRANESRLEQSLNKTIDATGKKLDQTLSEVKSSSDSVAKRITTELNGQLNAFQLSLHKIVTESEKSGKDLEGALAKYDKTFSDSLKWTAESTEERLKGVLTEVKAHSDATISFIDAEMKAFMGSIKKASEQLISFENNVRLLEKRIQEIDPSNEIKIIAQKINSNQKQNLIIGIIIILGLIAIAIFK